MKIIFTILSILSATIGFAQIEVGQIRGDRHFDCGTYSFIGPIYGIDFIDSLYNIPKICDSKNELEIRFSRAYGPTTQVDIIMITYGNSNWKAAKYELNLDTMTIDKDWNADHRKVVITMLTDPGKISGIVDELKLQGLFTLPDQTKLKLRKAGSCGTLYSITFKAGNQYRTYTFSDPSTYLRENPGHPTVTSYLRISDLFNNILR